MTYDEIKEFKGENIAKYYEPVEEISTYRTRIYEISCFCKAFCISHFIISEDKKFITLTKSYSPDFKGCLRATEYPLSIIKTIKGDEIQIISTLITEGKVKVFVLYGPCDSEVKSVVQLEI